MAKPRQVKKDSNGLIVLDFEKRFRDLNRSVITLAEEQPEDNIQIITLGDYINEKGTEHAVIRNVGRDLSSAFDGLNYVERRIMWTCFFEGFLHNRAHVKVADIIGRAMSNWYPHGDGAMLKTVWRIGRPGTNMITYLDKKGNFGNMVMKKGAASRYIDARLSKFAMDCFFSEMNVKHYIMDMRPNYKFSDYEPIYLPSKYPNWGLHWNTGIGYGASMNLPAFNLEELFNATIKLIDDPDAKIEIYPDTPNPMTITNKRELKNCFDMQSFKIQLRGRYEVTNIQDVVNGRIVDKPHLIFTSIPHNTDILGIEESIIQFVTDAQKNPGASKRFKEIKNIKAKPVGDDGVNFFVEYEKGYDPHVLAEKLYKSFGFATTVGALFCLTKDNNLLKYTPRQLTLEWIETRRDQKRRYILQRLQTVMIDKLTSEAFIKATEIDRTELAKIASECKDEDVYVKTLIKKYVISELEAKVLASTKNSAYTEANIKKVKANIKKYNEEYLRLSKLLLSEELIDEEIKEELRVGIERHKKPRNAMLINIESTSHDPEEKKVIAYDRVQYFGAENVPAMCTLYDKMDNSYELISLKNKDAVAVFNSDGFIKQLDGFAFNITQDAIGLSNLGLSKTVKMLPVTNKVKYFCVITKQGFAKILEADECTKSTKTKCISLSPNDKIVDVIPLMNLKGYIALMTDDRMFYVKTDSIAVQKRGGSGNKVIKEDVVIQNGGKFNDDHQYIMMNGEYGYTKCITKGFLHYNKKTDNSISFNGKNLKSIVPLMESGKLSFVFELGEDIRSYEIKDGELHIYPLLPVNENSNAFALPDYDNEITIPLATSISTPTKAFSTSKSGLFKVTHV